MNVRTYLDAGLPLPPIAGGDNVLDLYIPQLWATESLIELRKNLVMAQLVHRDFENAVAARGDTVNTRKPASFTSMPFTGAIDVQDAVAENVPVVLDQHQHVAFRLGDQHRSLAMKDLVAEFISPAMYAIAAKVDADLWGLYADVPYYYGAAGSTPDAIDDITGVRRLLQDQLVPLQARRLAIDPAAEEGFLKLSTFHEADKVGDAGTALREASLGRKFGFDIFMSQQAPFHARGAGWGLDDPTPSAPQVAGDVAAGATSAAIDNLGSATTVIKRGDIFSVPSDPKPYVVIANATVQAGSPTTATISFAPAARVGWANNAPITVLGNHQVNLAFHENAFALVSRPLAAPPDGTGARSAVVQQDGIGIRSTVAYDVNTLAVVVVLDILYGVKTLDRALAARLLG